MRKTSDYWIGEYWCRPVKGECSALCRVRYIGRKIARFFRPALMALAMWAIVPNVNAEVCNGYHAGTRVDCWIF